MVDAALFSLLLIGTEEGYAEKGNATNHESGGQGGEKAAAIDRHHEGGSCGC